MATNSLPSLLRMKARFRIELLILPGAEKEGKNEGRRGGEREKGWDRKGGGRKIRGRERKGRDVAGKIDYLVRRES